ncbi:MAG TPA: ABC transporter ATP-binding protein [Candidatus Saccharimonadales bacterium]|jgi:ATP-binding cassette subfamily B protein|nr:ABC transporter ATP-binding protein [Candidatus Saccharimonadales bacterium]
MTKKAEFRRDREITRAIHRLFFKATWADKPGGILCVVLRVPALILYNILIPLEIAYGVQAIFLQQFDKVQSYAINIMLLALGYSVLWALGGLAITKNGRIGSQYVQRTVFGNFLQKDYEFYGNSFSGALGSQATQLRSVYNEYSQILFLLLPNQLVVIVTGMVIIAWHSWLLALITLISMSVVLSFTIWFSRWRLKLRRALNEAGSELAGRIGDALSHGATVKSFASEAYEEQHLEATLGAWGRIQQRTWNSSIPADTVRMTLAAIATCALLLSTAHLYKNHAITIAMVTLVQLYVIKMIAATEAIATIVKQYETVMGTAHQTLKTMMVKPLVTDPARPAGIPKANLEIAFNKINYRYSEATKRAIAVSEFSLVIEPGEKIGLVGYSGSGKTTLTKLLLRFMDTTSGTITVGGVDVRDALQRELRARIAYVPQEPLLFHRSIAENIAYGRPGASKKEIEAAAKLAYVDEFVDDLPQKYQTMVGERGVKLSGGQRQRVAIARALLRDAPILVLDEATSALDSRSEKLIQQALWELMKDRTALVVAHRLSTIQRMDRIVVMDKGCIVQCGSHNELLKQKKGIYAKLWAHQSGGYVGVPAPQEL